MRLSVLFVILTVAGCGLYLEPVPPDQSGLAQLVARGVVELRQGDLQRAAGAFRAAEEIHPSAQSAEGLGCVAAVEGDFQTARLWFDEAMRRDPSYTSVTANRALVEDMQGENDGAGRLYRQALREAPDDANLRNNYAAYLAEYGRTEEAQGELFKAQALMSDDVITHNLMRLESHHGESKTEN